jgi:hypothetical protein
MPYKFRCRSGHEQGVFPEKPPDRVCAEMSRCWRCNRATRLVHFRTPPLPSVRLESFEYMSPTYHVPITSRRQLAELDKQHGNAPLEYIKETPAKEFAKRKAHLIRGVA